MLRPAQLYTKQLRIKNIESWHQPENIYWHGGTGEYEIQLPDNNKGEHAFVSVDDKDNILGYISYAVDWETMSAENLGIISYKKGSVMFAKDVLKAVIDCFQVYGMNRIQWFCWADNPAIRGYRNFIRKYGGKECGYLRQAGKLRDGKLHDSVLFEVLAEEFELN